MADMSFFFLQWIKKVVFALSVSVQLVKEVNLSGSLSLILKDSRSTPASFVTGSFACLVNGSSSES